MIKHDKDQLLNPKDLEYYCGSRSLSLYPFMIGTNGGKISIDHHDVKQGLTESIGNLFLKLCLNVKKKVTLWLTEGVTDWQKTQ